LTKLEKARELLGLNENSNEKEVKLAYRRACSIHHPDRATGDRVKFDEINKAYRLVLKHVRRGQICHICFGTGKITITRGIHSIQKTCNECKGSGAIHN
jgi:DnaJ-class molecular chaperone